MQTLNRLCGTGKNNQSEVMVAFRYVSELTNQNEILRFSLHGVPIKEIITPKVFENEKQTLDYILNIHRPVQLRKASPSHVIVQHIRSNANEIARNTRRGVGNCIVAGEKIYNHLVQLENLLADLKPIQLEKSTDLPDDTAVLCYRASPSGLLGQNYQVDWGFFYGEAEGKIELYEFEQDTKFGNNTILSKSQDYYVLFTLVD
jgi:hypothetical protein